MAPENVKISILSSTVWVVAKPVPKGTPYLLVQVSVIMMLLIRRSTFSATFIAQGGSVKCKKFNRL